MGTAAAVVVVGMQVALGRVAVEDSRPAVDIVRLRAAGAAA